MLLLVEGMGQDHGHTFAELERNLQDIVETSFYREESETQCSGDSLKSHNSLVAAFCLEPRSLDSV